MTLACLAGRTTPISDRLDSILIPSARPKSPVLVDQDSIPVLPMTTHSACEHAGPALADGNRGVSVRARGTHEFKYIYDLTLGSPWELAPPQRVDSTGGALPGLSVVAYTLHAHSKQDFVDPDLKMSHLILDIHPLPCQTSSPASKPPPAAQSGLA